MTRRRIAFVAFARQAGATLVDEFNDAAVSGADPIDTPASLPCWTGLKVTVSGPSLSKMRHALPVSW